MSDTPTEKQCTKCLAFKAMGEYYRDKRAKDGKTMQCKKCKKASVMARYVANPDKIRERKRVLNSANRDKINAQQRERYAANPDKYNARKRGYREADLDKYKKQEAVRRAANRDKISARNKSYREADPDKYNARQKARREADPDKYSAQRHERAARKRESRNQGALIGAFDPAKMKSLQSKLEAMGETNHTTKQ